MDAIFVQILQNSVFFRNFAALISLCLLASDRQLLADPLSEEIADRCPQ